MNRTICRAAFSCAVLFGCAALVLAQEVQPPAQPRATQPRVGQPAQPAQPGQFGQPGQPGQPGQIGRPGLQGQQLEPSIVTLLIIDNNKEIALAKLGQQTSKNDEVKQFCEMIEKDHASFVEKLQERMAGRQRLGAATGADQGFGAAGRTATTTQPRDAATQPGRIQPGQPAQPGQLGQAAGTAATQDRDLPTAGQALRSAADQVRGQTGQRIIVARPIIGNQPGSELLQLHQELAEKCLDSARREAEKLGEDFDKHFLGAQIVEHKGMLDKLQVFEQHVSPQARQLLTQAQETTRKHLDHAQQLHEQLSKEGGAAGARASERKTETSKDRE